MTAYGKGNGIASSCHVQLSEILNELLIVVATTGYSSVERSTVRKFINERRNGGGPISETELDEGLLLLINNGRLGVTHLIGGSEPLYCIRGFPAPTAIATQTDGKGGTNGATH